MATTLGVFKSANDGESWTPLISDSSTYYAVASTQDGWVFAGSDSGVVRSTNGGSTWERANAGITDRPIRSLLSTSGGILYAGSEGGRIYRSSNRGESWSGGDSSLGAGTVTSIVVNSAGHVFAGFAGGGVFRSTTQGMSWEAINAGLTNQIVKALVVPPNDHIFACIWAKGVYRSTGPTTSVDNPDVPSETTGQLSQSYPNPFNPTTVISYELPAVCEVLLVVYDLLGREVAVLVNERKGPGRYNIRFDAAGLASGVYLYRMTAGSFAQTRKMIVVR
jgi:hypothetical protein